MYNIGKKSVNFISCQNLNNKIIASQFFDNKEIKKEEKISHCCFTNISFKNSKLKKLNFENCVFFHCYFRETEIIDCKFIGCKFINCGFRKINPIGENIFKFSTFKDCQVRYNFMIKCLPKEPSISKNIVQNLEIESYRLGMYSEYLKYKYKRIQINESCLKDAFLRKDNWNKGHFTILESFKAGSDWLVSKMNGMIWGYGERFSKLIISFLFINIILFIFIFWKFFDIAIGVTFFDIVIFSLENILSSGDKNIFISDHFSLEFIILFQKTLFILFLALFISLFTRRILQK